VFFAYSLEDVDRQLETGGKKIKAQTAIPRGTYAVVIDFSNRFQKQMMHVLNVPQFEGIRIHAGNTDKDTEGCILLGKVRSDNAVFNSREAVNALFDKVQQALASGSTVSLEIT
jgi:uroporphyrinogen-III synthase